MKDLGIKVWGLGPQADEARLLCVCVFDLMCVCLSDCGRGREEAPAEFFEGGETNAKLRGHGLLGQVEILGQHVKLHLLVVRGASGTQLVCR